MHKQEVFLISIWVCLIACAAAAPANAQSGQDAVPTGFYLIASAPGVALYQKDYRGGSPDYVQVINLKRGARLVLLHGEVTEPRPGKGAYGGNDARLKSRTLPAYWDEISAADRNAFCVTNGQFFFMKESPTRLPLPLKVSGEIISDGYALSEFPDQKLILELWEGRANITSLSQESLYSSTAPDVVAGLTETAPKRITHYVARTFIGVDDRDSNGSTETVLIFNSQLSRQKDAARVLTEFGADRVMMLDGGGSTQLICQGKSYISSERFIPQAIGVIAANAGEPESIQPNLPDPAEGENFPLAGTPESTQPLAPTPENEPAEPTYNTGNAASAQTRHAAPAHIQFSDVLFVPLVMSPVFAVLLFFVARLRF
jgi:hypothetical protein